MFFIRKVIEKLQKHNTNVTLQQVWDNATHTISKFSNIAFTGKQLKAVRLLWKLVITIINSIIIVNMR